MCTTYQTLALDLTTCCCVGCSHVPPPPGWHDYNPCSNLLNPVLRFDDRKFAGLGYFVSGLIVPPQKILDALTLEITSETILDQN